ncbi:MAG: cyclic nucleotide-binding domain-containing protein [Thermodesulfovibrionales bacterium]
MDLWESYFAATRSQNWKKAVEILFNIKEKEPENPQVFLKIGDAYQKLGDIEKAVPAYSQAAYLLLKDGFIQKALAVYKIILRLDPDNHEAINKTRDLLVEIETARLRPVPGEVSPSQEIEVEKVVTERPESPPSIEEMIVRTSYAETPVEIDITPEFLKSLPGDEKKRIMEGLNILTFNKGDIVIEEGDSGDSIYLIKSGRAKVSTHVLGKVIELAILDKGDIFGEVAFLTGRPRTATVTAIERLEVLEFTRPVLERIIERDPSILKTLQDFYYSRLQNTITKAREVSVQSTLQRGRIDKLSPHEPPKY